MADRQPLAGTLMQGQGSGLVSDPASATPAARARPVAGTLRQAPGGATCCLLSNGQWHWQHGPIDLLIGVDGEAALVEAALAEVFAEFADLMAALVTCLPLLRSPVTNATDLNADRWPLGQPMAHAVANRMLAACGSHRQSFVTPMIAVAGSVADVVCERLARAGLRRVFVNNGGDIALRLQPGQSLRLALAPLRAEPALAPGQWPVLTIHGHAAVRGVATSGWRGRSFSLGVADAVTVLAASASAADAAATLIANATNVESTAVLRRRACDLDEQSDLGQRLVTTEVGPLTARETCMAVSAGQAVAESMYKEGEIIAARIVLGSSRQLVGAPIVGVAVDGFGQLGS